MNCKLCCYFFEHQNTTSASKFKPCPKVRTLPIFWQSRAQKCEPFLRMFAKGAKPSEVLASMCPKVRTLSMSCLDVLSYAKTSNPFTRICTKNAPPHDRPKKCIFVMNLWRQNAIKMAALFLTFLLCAACGRKLRTICAQAGKCKEMRTLSKKCPKMRTF